MGPLIAVPNGVWILFGAGGAATNYLKTLASADLPYLIVDNDPEKWKCFVRGISVVSPLSIDWRNVERVEIASIGLRDIENQLEELGVGSEKVTTPPKSAFSDGIFQPAENRRFALTLLAEIMKWAPVGPIVAVYGAALGLARDGDLIRWDADIDLVAPAEAREALTQHFKELQTGVMSHYNKNRDIDIFSATLPSGQQLPLSIEYFETQKRVFTQDLFGSRWHWSTNRFTNPDRLEIDNRIYNLPSDARSYLEDVYGPNWGTANSLFSARDYGGKSTN